MIYCKNKAEDDQVIGEEEAEEEEEEETMEELISEAKRLNSTVMMKMVRSTFFVCSLNLKSRYNLMVNGI